MASEDKLREQVTRAERAKRERQDPLVSEFFDKAKAACHKHWSESAPGDGEFREKVYLRLQAIEDVEQCFRATIEGGKVAANELFRMQQEKQE